MESFASLFPELATAMAAELRATAREDLALELETADVGEITFDQDAASGYIALQPLSEPGVGHGTLDERPGRVVRFTASSYATLQLSNLGHVLGVAVVAPPPDLAVALRWHTSGNR